MKKIDIIDRHLIFEFLKPFLGSLILFLGFTHLIDIMERLDIYTKYEIPFAQVLVLYLYKTPKIAIQMMPSSILFATVFSLGQLVRFNEIIAIFSSGRSFYRLIVPLIFLGVLISILMLLFSEFVMPRATERADHRYDSFKSIVRQKSVGNITKYGYQNLIYHIGYYDNKQKMLRDVQIIKRKEDSSIIFRIDAKIAYWDEDSRYWLFEDIVIRHFDEEDNIISTEKFDEKSIILKESPEDFARVHKSVEDMSIGESLRYIKRLKISGFSHNQELVELHFKFAFPFICLIIMLFGAPLSTYSSKSVLVISFGLTIIIGFLYYVLMDLGVSLGKNGVLPPFFAAWLGNIFFAGIGAILIRKVNT